MHHRRHRVCLHGVMKLHLFRQIFAHLLDPRRHEATVIGEERGRAYPVGEARQFDPAEGDFAINDRITCDWCMLRFFLFRQCLDPCFSYFVTSAAMALRSIFPFGLRGKDVHSMILCGTM